jgi:hypothetical protein
MTFHRCFLPSSVHLVMRFQRRIDFRNQPITNKNCLWQPCLYTDWDEMSNLYREPSIDVPVMFWFSWPCGFRGKYLKRKSTNEKQEFTLAAMFVNGSWQNEQSIDASYQVSVHLAMRCQRRRIFRNQPIRSKHGLWRPCLLMERNEISILYRGSSRHTSYQVSVHLVKWFQRRIFFRNQPIRSNNCLWRPCLITDRNEMSNLDRGPSKMLPTKFGSFVHAVSEEKIF